MNVVQNRQNFTESTTCDIVYTNTCNTRNFHHVRSLGTRSMPHNTLVPCNGQYASTDRNNTSIPQNHWLRTEQLAQEGRERNIPMATKRVTPTIKLTRMAIFARDVLAANHRYFFTSGPAIDITISSSRSRMRSCERPHARTAHLRRNKQRYACLTCVFVHGGRHVLTAWWVHPRQLTPRFEGQKPPGCTRP